MDTTTSITHEEYLEMVSVFRTRLREWDKTQRELKQQGNLARAELSQNRYRISALLNYYLAWRGVKPQHGMRENYFTCWIYQEEMEKLTEEFGKPKPKSRDL